MSFKVTNRKRSSTVVPAGAYRLRVGSFSLAQCPIEDKEGFPIGCRCQVLNKCNDQGEFVQLAFGISAANAHVASVWFMAMGVSEGTMVPDDLDNLFQFFEDNCQDAIIETTLEKRVTPEGYEYNIVWPVTNVRAAKMQPGDVMEAPLGM